MKQRTNTSSKTEYRKKRFDRLGVICWIILPVFALFLLLLDGFGLYSFTTERLIVLGAILIVVLLPFFNEITIKNLSVKKDTQRK